MSGNRWLNYSGQSAQQLIALTDDYHPDSIVLAFEEALDAKAARSGRASLSSEEIVVLAVEALEREANNGGYLQFLTSSSAEYAVDIVQALRRIGCDSAADLTDEALSALELPGPASTQNLARVLASASVSIGEKLKVCDERYFADVGDLAGPLLEFIRVNVDSISLLRRDP